MKPFHDRVRVKMAFQLLSADPVSSFIPPPCFYRRDTKTHSIDRYQRSDNIRMKLKIELDRQSETPLHRQLYDQMAGLILSGALEPGARIPASRMLAEDLGVSRPTVIACLEQLVQEGYIETRPNAGSFVSSNLSQETLKRSTQKSGKSKGASIADYELSDFGKFIARETEQQKSVNEPEISFYCWRPALDQFPLTEWARVLGRHTRTSTVEMLDADYDPQGRLDLREALAKLVKRFRQVSCHPDQIFPVMGLNQGLDLVSRLHLDRGSGVVLEEPGFFPSAFEACGAQLFPVPVDEDGLNVKRLPDKRGRDNFDLAYVTPAHQFPSGAVMPLARRLEFLQWASECGTLVLEDDYDSEYQYSGRPIPALMSLDREQRVIYLGTLNQIMFPSLGFGYLIVPPRLVPVYRGARKLAGAQFSAQIQAALAEFISEGHLDRHVKRLRSLYRDRRDALIGALEKRFKDKVEIGAGRRGVFISVKFNLGFDDDEIIERAQRAGVGLTSAREFYRKRKPTGQFILGFGSLTEREIEKGIQKLASVLLSA